MCHHQISRVMYIAMIAVMVSTGLVIFIYSGAQNAKAEDLKPFVDYGGSVISVSVPLIPNPFCPYYILMRNKNISPINPYPTFGLFLLPGSELNTYIYPTLFVPATNHIGGYLPTPQVACGVTPSGGPVFPVFFDFTGGRYLDAGSLGPDFIP